MPRFVTIGVRAAALAAAAAPGGADAHGFGQRYDLPVPLDLYLWGAGLTVALSFVLAALFLRVGGAAREAPHVDLSPRTARGRHALAVVVALLRVVAVALFVLVVVAGLFGAQDPFRNLAPTMVWVIWWVGLAYVVALVGNLWAVVNPLDAIFAWASALRARLRGAAPGAPRPYPAAWDAWPAVVLFVAFAWCELVWSGADRPAALAVALLVYAALTWAGMARYGRRTWRERGDVFAVVFGLLGRFAPLEIDADSCRLRLRPYASGLIAEAPVSPALVVLSTAVLAMVSFDGFAETPAWQAFAQWTLAAPALQPLWTRLAALSFTPGAALASAAIVAAPLLFLGVFLLACRLMAMAGGLRGPLADLAGRFVLTLIPIAIAYHLAHYLSYLAIAGQYVIPLASDPFGRGWNLFGTALYFIDIGAIGARTLWIVSVGAIVLGHVIAVFLAHRVALGVFADRRRALASQIPMVALMIGYTMLSLWIIAQPIVAD